MSASDRFQDSRGVSLDMSVHYACNTILQKQFTEEFLNLVTRTSVFVTKLFRNNCLKKNCVFNLNYFLKAKNARYKKR